LERGDAGMSNAGRIGLTGGIACGKSTVAAMLAARGARIVDADRIARDVVEPGKPAFRRVVERFGQAVVGPDGVLDRKALGRIVFADEQKRRELESIVHPFILQEIEYQSEIAQSETPGLPVIVDVPLLFELGMKDRFEEVVLVYAPEHIQLQRLMRRDGLDAEEARRRLAAQWPIERKRLLADVVIDNSGTLTDTERQVEAYWRKKGWTR